MGYIHCCGGLRKTRSFVLAHMEDFVLCELDYLIKCPVCGHLVVQLTRINTDDEFSTVRFVNKKAERFWKKNQNKILYEEKFIDYTHCRRGTFYLNYNEFGVKKRCYSNISSLKIGLNTTY